MFDAISEFRNAIRASGLEPPAVIEPGTLHRFPGVDKHPSNRAGWFILFADGKGGSFGDWSTGFSANWQAERERPFTPAEEEPFRHLVVEAKRRAELARQTRQTEAAARAMAIWNAALPAIDTHPYLLRKGIGAHGARFHKGLLLLPVTDFNGQLTSLQFIAPDGGKLLLSGGRKQGCLILVSPMHYTQNTHNPLLLEDSAYCAGSAYRGSKIIVCEGWATGCTLAEDDPEALVLSAIDAGNLKEVAISARHRWPSAELIIAGDDDRRTVGNPGATKARAAAIAANALLALPQWPEGSPGHLTDFNDLALWLAKVAA